MSGDSEAWLLTERDEDTFVMTPHPNGTFAKCESELVMLPAATRGPRTRFEPPQRARRAGAARVWSRQRRHHGHIKAIAFWYRASGVLGLFAATVGAMILAFSSGVLALILLVVCGGLSALNYVVGTGLWRLRAWGRWIVVVLTGLSLASAGLGLVAAPGWGSLLGLAISGLWNGGILWALLGPQGQVVFSPAYAKAELRGVPWAWSPFFLVPVVLNVIAIIAAAVLIGTAMAVGG